MDITETLMELSSLPGPSGFEEEVATHVRALLEPVMDEVWGDALGNTIAVRRCGKDGARKLLFDAHIDETGIIVTGAEEGFLRFVSLGATDARVLPASGILLMTDPPLHGVVCTMPPHVIKSGDAENYVKIEDMFIDVGLSQEEALKRVPAGTPGVFDSTARRFGDGNICGKALDGRAGITAVLCAIKLIGDASLNVDIYVMASVQGEIGKRGAAPGVYDIAPDWCVVLESGYAKTPDTRPTETNEEAGGGVVISRGPNMNTEMTEIMIGLARENRIKHQINVEPGGNSGTNARAIQVSRGGVATALLSIPTKYMHTAHEVVSTDDVESAARLLAETANILR